MVEDDFGREVRAVTNGWPRCENAIASARELAYVCLNPDATQATLRLVAENWLERFGRNELQETRMAQRAISGHGDA